MQTNMTSFGKGVSVAALAAVVGLQMSALAQDRTLSQPQRDQRDQRDQRNMRDMANEKNDWTGMDFCCSSKLIGANVYNGEDSIAEVENLLVDRGTGSIRYAILDTGTILGMGGRRVAVSFDALRWNEAEEHLMYNATEEQLKALPEFNRDEWAGMKTARKGTMSKFGDWLRGEDAREWGDPYSDRLSTAEKMDIEGEITRVERVDTAMGEQLVVTVKPNSGEMRRVALGPSWYVSGGGSYPQRGQRVTLKGYNSRDGNDVGIARTMTMGGKETNLRTSEGGPMWSEPWVQGQGREYSASSWRYILATEIDGADLHCRGTDCGKVEDVIFDRSSGRIAFLSIDPNKNFLGMADTKRLLPWGVVTVGMDGKVYVDATKEMIVASPETPDDLSMLSGGTTANSVFNAYQIDRPTYRRNMQETWDRTNKDGRNEGTNRGRDMNRDRDNDMNRDRNRDSNRDRNDDMNRDRDTNRDRDNTMNRDRDRNRNDNVNKNDPSRRNTSGDEGGPSIDGKISEPWSRTGPMYKSIDKNSARGVQGEVVGVTSVNIGDQNQMARALRIRTKDGSEELVVVGPVSYMTRNNYNYATGDRVDFDVWRTNVDGQPYWVARRFSRDGQRVDLVDENGRPVWDR